MIDRWSREHEAEVTVRGYLSSHGGIFSRICFLKELGHSDTPELEGEISAMPSCPALELSIKY